MLGDQGLLTGATAPTAISRPESPSHCQARTQDAFSSLPFPHHRYHREKREPADKHSKDQESQGVSVGLKQDGRAGREGLPWQLRPGLPMQIQSLAGD